MFPSDIDLLNDVANTSFWCIDSILPIAREVKGFLGFETMVKSQKTIDDYSWFWTLQFNTGQGAIILLALPWFTDHSQADGTSADRSVAMYTRGGVVSEAQFAALIKGICASASRFKESRSVIEIAYGDVVTYDKDVRANRIVNNGSIKLAPGATLTATELVNSGFIVNMLGECQICVSGVTADGGVFIASQRITVSSPTGNITVRGGTFSAPEISFSCKANLDIKAKRLNGVVFIQAPDVCVSTEEGDMNVVDILSKRAFTRRDGEWVYAAQS